jgi:anti-sigma B factor antagonist
LLDHPSHIEIQSLPCGAALVLIVSGELDIGGSPRLAVEINEALRRDPDRLVIDLGGVSFLDSTSLAVLLNARRRTLRQGIEFKLACNVPSTLQLLALTRLAGDFDVYPTRDEALSS